jgi:protein TonB
MSSTRTAVVCGTLALAVVAGLLAQDAREEIGPLEKRAKAVTPENPIPRRTYSIAPAYPAEAQAIDAAAIVSLRVTLDEAGRVTEIRRVNNPIVMMPPAVPANPAALQSAGEALVRSSMAALRQWQYDAPADGPISFGVTFTFRPGAEPTMTQDAGERAGGAGAAPPPPPPPPPPVTDWPAAAGALRAGWQVMPPVRTRAVNPVYPDEAQARRVQGVVIMEALIGVDGKVTDVRILTSVPALDDAAVEAVRQWEYTPTLLNGVPVPVVMTVTVQFTLT